MNPVKGQLKKLTKVISEYYLKSEKDFGSGY